MPDLLEMTIPKDEQEEIKEFVSIVAPMDREDKAVLLTIANAFRVRNSIDNGNRGR